MDVEESTVQCSTGQGRADIESVEFQVDGYVAENPIMGEDSVLSR